jgi:hypothetical protein
MTDVDRVFEEYVAEHRAGGEADPLAYLERVEGAERAQLAALIDAYLVRSPGQRWDEEAYHGSAAERLVESLEESLTGASGSWPVVLPRLRHQAKIRREQLVRRLADALGVAGREEKVAYYYNQMEHGRISPQGVSDRVLDALAAIVGSTREALREAGERAVSPRAGDEVFARMAAPPPEYEDQASPGPARSPGRAEPERDEVDELFLGG